MLNDSNLMNGHQKIIPYTITPNDFQSHDRIFRGPRSELTQMYVGSNIHGRAKSCQTALDYGEPRKFVGWYRDIICLKEMTPMTSFGCIPKLLARWV